MSTFKEKNAENDKFIKEAAKKRANICHKLATNLLIDSFTEDIAIFDAKHLHKRSLQIIEEKIMKVKTNSKKIKDLRKELLAEYIKEINKLKADKPQSKGETKKRDKRCEPICNRLIGAIVDEQVVLNDHDFIDQCIINDEQNMLYSIIRAYLEGVFDVYFNSIDMSWADATRHMWNGRYKDEVTFKQLDRVIKGLPLQEKK